MADPKPTMLDPEDEDFDYETPPEEKIDDVVEIEKGAIYSGEVVQLQDDCAVIDFGGPADGILPFDKLQQGGVSVGDEKLVKIIAEEHEGGCPLLSEKEAVADRSWELIAEAYEKNGFVEAKIFKKIKGGFLVRILNYLTAFMPLSHLSLSRKKNTDKYLDKTFKMKVLEFDRAEENVVVSRREYLEEKRGEERKKFFESLEPGQWIKGKVKNIVNFGAFINLGPVDGLLHKSDIAWGPVREVNDYVELHEEIEVMVLEINQEDDKVSLGLKQKYPDPWEKITDRYEAGLTTTGEIVDVWSDGIFVRLEKDVEGKIPEEELAWTKTWEHPEEQFSRGSKIKVKILEIDEARRHVLLSHKQTQKNPWKILQNKFPRGTVLAAPVVDITSDTVKVQLLENVRGRIKKSNIGWKQDNIDLFKQFKIGQQVRCKVLRMEPDSQRVELGIKQMLPNPWVKKARKYPVGSAVEGTVTTVLQFGAFVKIEDELEGLVHVSEMVEGKRVNPFEIVSEGEKVMVQVIGLDEKERKIDLSIKEYKKHQEKQQMEEYMQEKGADSSNVTIGDLLGDKLPDALKG